MLRRIPYINLFLVGIIGLVALSFMNVEQNAPNADPLPLFPKRLSSDLPPSPFAQDLEALDNKPFALNWIDPVLELPDLRESFQFSGYNKRPDATNKAFHLTTKDNGSASTKASIGEKIYLVYQPLPSSLRQNQASSHHIAPLWNEPTHSFAKGKYLFSPNNRPTSLWIEIEAAPSPNQISLLVSMVDELGQPVGGAQEYRRFTLHIDEQHNGRFSFEFDGQRGDASILARQRARWFGRDLFLAIHGGPEYAHYHDRERIDFMQPNATYSLYAKGGDMFAWKNGRWITTEDTQGAPLLVVKSAEWSQILLELWDPEGKGCVPIKLQRSNSPVHVPEIEKTFVFVGAKTWTQFICQVEGKRTLIKADDWFLFTEGHWSKLATADAIDQYVANSNIGPLLVIDKMVTHEGKQTLVGHVFNTLRTEMKEVRLSTQTSFYAQEKHQQEIPNLPPRLGHNKVAKHLAMGGINHNDEEEYP